MEINGPMKVVGFRIVAAGYFIIAAMLFVLQLLHVFTTNTALEFTRIGVDVIGWLVVLAGAFGLMKLGREFVKLGITCVFALGALAGEAFFTWRNLKAGMGDGAFIDIYVQFMFFLGIAALLYSYAKVLRGLSPIVESIVVKGGVGKTFYHTWLIGGITILASLVLVQLASMLPKSVEFIGVSAISFIGFLAQLYICKILLDTYNAVAGRRVSRSSVIKRTKGVKGKSNTPKSKRQVSEVNRNNTRKDQQERASRKTITQTNVKGARSKNAGKGRQGANKNQKKSNVRMGGAVAEKDQRKVSRKDLAAGNAPKKGLSDDTMIIGNRTDRD